MTPSLFLEQRPHPLPGTAFGLWRCVQYTTAKGTRQEPFDPILNPLGQIGDEVSSLFSTNSSPCFWDLPSFALCHFPRRRVHRPGGAAPPLPPSKNPQQACVRPAGGSSAERGDRWSAFLHHRFVFLQGVVPLGVVLIVSVVGEQAGFLQPAGQVVGDLHRPEVV